MDHTKLLKELFEYTAGFNFSLYEDFLGELCKTYDREQRSLPIEKNEESAIAQKSKIGRYQDNQWKNIDFLIFKLKNWWSIQKARHLQRNVISSYLKDYGVYNWVDHVIAVFYADGYADWRLSFVKQQFKLDPEKKKVINEFTPAKRFSFLIEKGSKNQTIRKQSLELLKASIKPNINEVEKIFSVEKVTKEFFDNYKWLYGKLKEAFENDKIFEFIQQKYNQWDPHFTENFVKKLLGQIVFLYFLQKKGWLGVQKDQKRWDGDKQFLRTLYTQCVSEKKLFFNDYLEPLFYNTLNKERPWHWSDYFWSKIPYLNGGLFQPINDYNWDGVENTLLSSNTSNHIFGEILDTFDTFNFTIYENDPLEQDVAVDPEMLGKIFENLLPDNERKGKGAFYTPREIVHYMCKQALIQYLVTETEIPEDRISRLIERKDSMDSLKKLDEFTSDEGVKKILRAEALAIDNALKEVKIVDPAVWSGAFPMGILKEIVDIRRYIRRNILQDTMIPKNELLYTLKKQTLSHCIYGVDLDPGAVDIAKLRFWLSLVVDYEWDHIEPLPNLDYKIMQWNSLIENPIIGDQVIDLWLDQKSDKISQKERKEIMRDNGLFESMIESSALLKKLTILHSDYFKETSPDHKKRLKAEIHTLEQRLILQKAKEAIEAIESEIQNNYRGEMNDKKARDLTGKYETINEIKNITNKLTETWVKNYFPWRLHFWEIFRDNGWFDIVIGNPPYVSALDASKDSTMQQSKKYYREIYPELSWTFDLYSVFLLLWNNISKNNWSYSRIIPNKLLVAQYWEKIISKLQDMWLHTILNLSHINVFDNASVYPIIIMADKSRIDVKKYSKLYVGSLDDLDNKNFKLEENVSMKANSIEIKNTWIKIECWMTWFMAKSIIENINNNAITDKNIEFIVSWSIDRYEFNNSIVRYMGSSYEKPNIDINGSAISTGKRNLWISPKIIIAWMTKQIEAIFSSKKLAIWVWVYAINDFWWYNPFYLLWLLNSKYLSYYLMVNFKDKHLAGWYLAINKNTIERLPIANPIKDNEQSIISLVKLIMDQKDANPKVDTSSLEKEIDQIVYKLYELTDEEIAIVEESVKR